MHIWCNYYMAYAWALCTLGAEHFHLIFICNLDPIRSQPKKNASRLHHQGWKNSITVDMFGLII